ncbi:MAG: hypothetical protein ABTQ32_26030 [Myxococcaceae bacterium]
MLLSLALTLSLSAATPSSPGIHLTASADRSAFLLAQGPPPLPVRQQDLQPVGSRQLELQREIDAINDDLRGLKTDWPTVSVVLAYLGFSVSPIALVGLLFMALGSVTIPAITIAGVVMLVIGLGGLALGIAGVVTGISASTAATNTRNDLLKQRGELERELKLLKQGGAPGVDRSFESSPRLITIAAF